MKPKSSQGKQLCLLTSKKIEVKFFFEEIVDNIYDTLINNNNSPLTLSEQCFPINSFTNHRKLDSVKNKQLHKQNCKLQNIFFFAVK